MTEDQREPTGEQTQPVNLEHTVPLSAFPPPSGVPYTELPMAPAPGRSGAAESAVAAPGGRTDGSGDGPGERPDGARNGRWGAGLVAAMVGVVMLAALLGGTAGAWIATRGSSVSGSSAVL